MLQNLSVENYALIEKLNIELNQGLNIITGETGAGKSILLGALGLILGQRADTSSLKNPEKSCVVEGTFRVEKMNLSSFFEENDIEYDDQAIVRRVISPSGKSRAFINDTPVTLNTLKELGVKLIDIHSQHESLLIANQQFQLNILDVVANNARLLEDYKQIYRHLKKEEEALSTLVNQQVKTASDYDYFSFQHQQLEDAKLKADEQQQLEEEESELANAENIKAELQLCTDIIANGEQATLNNLKACSQSLKRIKEVFHKADSLYERIESVAIELKDINNELESYNDKVEVNPERLAQVKERLDLIYTLQQKHRASSIDELIAIKDELEERLQQLGSYEEQIATKKAIVEELKNKATKLANELTTNRKAAIEAVKSHVEELLAQLGMPFARIAIEVEEAEFGSNGADKVELLFSANKQLQLQSVSKVASGGEMSRLMLTIKTLLAKEGNLPTIIFDEIDTGVSGEVADKMGSIIKDVSKNIQVVNITHLPQIASKGDHHFYVYKDNNDQTTSTKIKLLTEEERITEIAKMLSGKDVSTAAIQNAKALLKASTRY